MWWTAPGHKVPLGPGLHCRDGDHRPGLVRRRMDLGYATPWRSSVLPAIRGAPRGGQGLRGPVGGEGAIGTHGRTSPCIQLPARRPGRDPHPVRRCAPGRAGLISSLGVLALGLLGRRVAGAGVGLIAAGIAAIDPLWVQWGGFVMSESLYLVVVPLMLLLALRCLDRPNRWDFLALGLLVGIATLIRSEAIDFVVLLGAVVLVLATRSWHDRAVFAAVYLAGLGLLLVPWVVRNDQQMGALTLSTNGGLTLSGSYSAGTISPSSPYYGSFDNNSQFGAAAVLVRYGTPPDHARHWTELTLSDALGSAATTYAMAHLSDLPGEALAREGRVWGVYAPGTELTYDTTEETTGARGPKQVGQLLNWVLLALAVPGAVVLGRRSRRRLLVILVPVAVVAVNAAAFYGSTRIRVAAEPSLDVLAAIGTLWIVGYIVRSKPSHSTGRGRLAISWSRKVDRRLTLRDRSSESLDSRSSRPPSGAGSGTRPRRPRAARWRDHDAPEDAAREVRHDDECGSAFDASRGAVRATVVHFECAAAGSSCQPPR